VTHERKLISQLRLAALPVIVIVAVLVAWKLGYFELERRQRLFDTVQRVRVLPGIEAVYVVAYALAITICLPAAVATLLGGAIFGMWFGALLAWLGSLAGTVLAHFLARSVARAPARRLFGEHRLLRQLKDHDDVFALLRLRVLPVAPFAVLDYVAGVAGVSLPRLLLATMIGVIPSVVAYTYVGAELLRGIVSKSEASHRALSIAGAVTLLMLLLSVAPRLWQKKRN
jgi:uncharacterized membrane protein YdjX (TVP38/TMEM64 family)